MTIRPHLGQRMRPRTCGIALLLLAAAACEGADRSYHGRTALQWAARLRDTSVAARVEAAEALYHVEPRTQSVIRPLLAAMRDTSAAVQAAVATALSTVGDPALPGLIEATTDDHASVRTIAMSILADEGPSAISAVPAIARALRDTDADVRLAAAQALDRLGPAAKDATPALLETVAQDSGVVKAAALQALGDVGAEHGMIASVAPKALHDSSAAVRHAAIRLLTMGAFSVRDELEAARGLLADRDAGVRAAAYRALARAARDSVVGPAARRLLQAGAQDPSPAVRTAAARTLEPPPRARDPDGRYTDTPR